MSSPFANATENLMNTEESSPESEESQESVEPKVPDQLIMEFLINMMKHDYVVAEKLCQMILLYDPEHEQALSFKPLLQDMIQAIKDNAEDSESESESAETEDSSESDSNGTDSSSTTESEQSECDSTNQN